MDSAVKPRKTASTSTSPTKGVQKFYTKIRHKIEDIPPKISAKLNKCNVVVPKISPEVQKPTAPPRAARRNRMQGGKKVAEMDKKPPAPGPLSAPYENIRISSNPNGLHDSDEECRMSMNDSTLSLEDEIFEELEKVAHDEAKLKAVLKNFDKILAEFNERNSTNSIPALKITSYSSPSSPSQEIGILGEKGANKETQKSEKEGGGHKPLQKSKTCSIIESRCILKKSVSDPTESKTGHMSLDDFPHFKAFQVTKSLWNLKDFEEFAKTGKKIEKFECKLPILKTNYNTYKVEKNSTNPEGVQTAPEPPKSILTSQKVILPKAKSVWELSPSQNSPSHNNPCTRTYSGSKIPVMKPSPQKLATAGRSNSFCDQVSPSKQIAPQTKTIQVGKVLPTPKRSSPAKNTTVIKIVHNLNEMSATTASKVGPSPNHKQPLIRTTSSLSASSNQLGRYLTPSSNISSVKRRSAMSSASSTPHSLHKVGMSVKAATPTSYTTALTPSIAGPSKLKSANSEMSLTCLRPPRGVPATKVNSNKAKNQDVLLNKCLQKGHDLLRKVEAFGSVTKLPEARKVWVQHDSARKGPTVKISPSRRDSKPKDFDYTLVADKKISSILIAPSEDVVDSPFEQRPVPKIVYATESVIQFPRLESCKIIPPILGNPSQQTAELLVNVKAMQQPLRVHQDSMLCVNSDVLRSEKEYHSDCSDDSGHISNENDEMLSSAISAASTTSIGLSRNQKGTKISELLEKFEPVAAAAGREAQFNSAAAASPINGTEECGIGSAPKKLCTTVKVAEVRPVKCITSSMEICPMFSSEVLFRSGVLSQLEAKRDELLSDRIVQLQAYCRGYLARRRVAQRRVQELAVRCIQRNVKAFLAVRDWPWWRLLVRVTPLLNVHRTEEQLKIANDELQSLRAKLEKIENDRNALKTENDKLEAKLSEMTVDLAEERSTSNIATERLEAETAERLKLEKELQEQQHKVKNLQETSEKLEMELICAKSDLNGISEDEDPDNEDNGGVYKLKYERVARELEFTKRRLQSQHEHDLEQLVGLKKQLEKKLADAYEEVEEQRQVVGQWKRKTQKMTNEMNDLRMLLEEQNGRNNLLEKKQRKFDSECQSLQDAARQERQAKERLAREKDVLIAEKFTLEQNLADTRLELELKEEKLAALQRDMAEMTFGGGTEEEVAQLRRSKMELDRRLKEQEEELDEMAGQVQLLEQAKLRLEMTLETMRKEARKEAQQRDDELEEARGSAYKKIKALECQLETEHEERTLLLREKHELERRLQAMEEQDRADRTAEEAVNQKLRRDLRKYKALLKDAHAQLERLKADSPGKALIRQLRNQLEDAEAARSMAIKSRQSAEAELSEVQVLLEEVQRARSEAEDKSTAAQRDRAELQAQIEENEEEMSELMKKFSQTVKQLNNEQTAISEAEIRISELEAERNSLKEQIAELQTRLENVENMSDPSVAVHSKRLELRAKELESRLELEQATRARLEVQANRHKDALEKVQNEMSHSKMRELQAQETLKKTQKNLRELREEFHVLSNREQESITRRKDLEKKLETAEGEVASLRNDLRLALQRIADLQQAMEEGDDDVTESEESDSTDASLSDLEQRLRPIQVKRTSVTAVKDTNGLDDSTLVLREKRSDNSPRITVTSPSTANGDTSFA